ncbi:MAG: TIGR03960 family B12-binding radical SAM protein [Deltaproteobacteria bacterium]|nr:TIGR03960 family B12-binding radical SAM protein [Deltaproteobacteria bacterium]
MRYGTALLEVEKPGRYEGLEAGAVVKPWDGARLRAVLCFPDVYEIGISHLGLQVLYSALNREDGILAERAYAPWMDMEALLRRRGWPLVSRESGRALRDFDLVGFTLQYELSATNILAMLDLGGVPLLASERGEDDPLVLGGGPVAANPEPLADFFDALFIGEAEEAAPQLARVLADAKEQGLARRERLERLAAVPGVYVPAFAEPIFEGGRFAGFRSGRPVSRRIVAELERAAPAEPLTPFIAAVHERISLEVARGCTRGCRFCQAGFLYRPVREREPGTLQEMARRGLCATGFEELGLLSLSTGDYSRLPPLLTSLMDSFAGDRVSVSLPSLRVDSLEGELLDQVARVRKTGFTVAPEAGTERMRRVINKNLTEEDILSAAERIFSAGWRAVKLYFMVGLPFETREDWEGIAALARKVARLAPPGKGRVSVSLSNFVPKPHTPFQWCRQAGIEEVVRAQEYFKQELRDRRLELKWHHAPMSLLEGVFARGDRRHGRAILAAYRKGCRMDGWTEVFRWDVWQEALAEAGLRPEEEVGERDPGAPLPWDLVDPGFEREFLVREWEKARAAEATGDCRAGVCQGCGLCDFEGLMPRLASSADVPRCEPPPEPAESEPAVHRVRFRYVKEGAASLLSHLETVAALHRAFRAARVPLAYSAGHHPHPKLTLGPALPLGTESRAELGEMKLTSVPPLSEAREAVNRRLPEGLRVRSLWLMGPESRALTGGNTREEYRLQISGEAREAAGAAGGWPAILERFWTAESFPIVKRRRNKPDRVLEAKAFVRALWLENGELALRVTRAADGTLLGPEDFLRGLVGLPEGSRPAERILKVAAELV